MIVLDASAAVDLLLDQPPHAERIRARITREGSDLAAPHLLDAEVAQVLRRLTAAGQLGPARAREAIDDLLALPIARYGHGPLLRRAFSLRANLTVYDALYLVLAEALDAVLLTRDARLGRLPLRRVATVEVIA